MHWGGGKGKREGECPNELYVEGEARLMILRRS
jgi:hypothetical protein